MLHPTRLGVVRRARRRPEWACQTTPAERKNKKEGKEPGGDAVCLAVFTSPSPTLKWPIVEIACSLAGLGRAAGQRGFTGPFPANPAAKNWASYLTLQRQHPFPSQGVITNIHVGGKKKASASCQGYTHRQQMHQQRDPLKGSREALRSSEPHRLPRGDTLAVCICLLTFQLSEMQIVTIFVCDARLTLCPS